MTIPTPDGHFNAVQVRRAAVGAYSATGAGAGHYMPATGTVETITASVQPMSQRDVQALDVGDKVVSAVLVITADPLNGPREGDVGGAEIPGDRLLLPDGEYEVIRTDTYALGQLDHIEAVAVLKREG